MKNLVIDKQAVKSNLRAAKERAGNVEIYADLSADAQGMGLRETAKLLRDEGVRAFAVSDPRDAAALRDIGFHDERIMMLRSTADSKELEELIDLNVVCTIGSYDAAVALNGIAEERSTVCEVQIKIDTGLGRYGFTPTEMDKISAIFKYMANLAVVGVFTSYSASWRSRKQTQAQTDLFESAVERIREMGYDPGMVHACDSAALFRYEFGRFDAVRVDTALSGRLPGKNIAQLRKVGYIAAGIEETGWFTKGHRVGGKITLKKPTRLAVLSVGYYHGYGVTKAEEMKSVFDFLKIRHRRMYVKINGHKARVLDIGTMHTIVDITKVDCTVGDTAIMDVDPVNVKGLAREYRDPENVQEK